MKSKGGFISFGLIVIAAIAVGAAAAYLIAANKTRNSPVPEFVARNLFGTEWAVDASTTAWKTYHDDRVGVKFKFPPEWISVTTDSGNRDREGEVLCGPAVEIQKYDGCVACIYDKRLTFSGPLKSNVTISVLKFNKQNPTLGLCDAQNISVDLLNEWDTLKSRRPDRFFINDGGVDVFDSGYFNSLGTAISQRYILLGGDVWIEAWIAFAPRSHSQELVEANARFGCIQDALGCLESWLRTGQTAQPIRKEFGALEEVIKSLTFPMSS